MINKIIKLEELQKKQKKSGKKSQLYVFAGIVIVLSIFLLTNRSSLLIKSTKADSSYFDNFYYEAVNVFNYAIAREENITNVLINYTEAFLEYTNDVNVVILYSNDGKIFVLNYLDENILANDITIPNKEVYEFDYEEIEDTEIEIKYRNNLYYFNFTYPKELRLLFVKDNVIYTR